MTDFEKRWMSCRLALTVRRWSWSVRMLVAVIAASACSSPQAPTPSPTLSEPVDEAPRVGVEQAKALVDSGEAVLVDTRSAEQFVAERAAGAVLAPLDEIAANPDISTISQIPDDQVMILYCT